MGLSICSDMQNKPEPMNFCEDNEEWTMYKSSPRFHSIHEVSKVAMGTQSSRLPSMSVTSTDLLSATTRISVEQKPIINETSKELHSAVTRSSVEQRPSIYEASTELHSAITESSVDQKQMEKVLTEMLERRCRTNDVPSSTSILTEEMLAKRAAAINRVDKKSSEVEKESKRFLSLAQEINATKTGLL